MVEPESIRCHWSFASYCSSFAGYLSGVNSISRTIVGQIIFGLGLFSNNLSALGSLLFTTCSDAVKDLCRPHVPFVRYDKGCPR